MSDINAVHSPTETYTNVPLIIVVVIAIIFLTLATLVLYSFCCTCRRERKTGSNSSSSGLEAGTDKRTADRTTTQLPPTYSSANLSPLPPSYHPTSPTIVQLNAELEQEGRDRRAPSTTAAAESANEDTPPFIRRRSDPPAYQGE